MIGCAGCWATFNSLRSSQSPKIIRLAPWHKQGSWFYFKIARTDYSSADTWARESSVEEAKRGLCFTRCKSRRWMVWAWQLTKRYWTWFRKCRPHLVMCIDGALWFGKCFTEFRDLPHYALHRNGFVKLSVRQRHFHCMFILCSYLVRLVFIINLNCRCWYMLYLFLILFHVLLGQQLAVLECEAILCFANLPPFTGIDLLPRNDARLLWARNT